MIRCSAVQRLGGWLAVSLVLAASGCGSGAPAGKVKGTITYNGSPVAAGSINFLSKSGIAAQAKLDKGTFVVDGSLPVGEYSVFVSPPRPEPQRPGTPTANPPAFDVPAKFQQPVSSGIVVKIAPGQNELKVAMDQGDGQPSPSR